MFTALDNTLAYQRREEMARQVGAGRLENELRAARGHRTKGRWSFRPVRALLAWANGPAEVARAGNG